MSSKWRVKFSCRHCGHVWKRTVESDEQPTPENTATPRCPNLACGELQIPRGMDFNSNKAPAAVGMNTMIKAVDETEKIVTQDYGMSDIQMRTHEGENSTPKLPPRLQAQADAMFAPRRRNQRSNLRAKNVIDIAAAGRLRDPKAIDVMSTIHENQWRPPVHYVNEPGS